MKRTINFCLVTVLSLSFALPAIAQKRTKPNSAKNAAKVTPVKALPPIPIEQFTLKNGLRVVLSQDNSVPVVSVAVYYDVGSRNEKKGRTGFAHLFEHMMFQGSENVKKAEHFQYISKVGGTMNGSTNSEVTNYYQTVPANQLPTALWLESDRMRSLKINKENLKNQQEAVKEEKRLRRDNQPYGQVFDIITEMTFKNFANSHSTIGSMDDLNAASVEDVAEFFRVYYAPNNAVLSIVGSYDAKEAKALISKYFDSIPSQTKPAQADVSEPTEVNEKTRTFVDPLAPFPAFLMSWKVPAQNTADFKALSLAGKLLYEGESSRLYQKLVKGDESVLQLFGFNDVRRGPSAALIGAIPKPGKDLKQIQQIILDEIKNMAMNGPTAEEMGKLRNQLQNEQVNSRQTSMYRAMQLAEFTVFEGNPDLINSDLETKLKITPEQIKAAVNKYLNTENRAQLNVVPGKDAQKTN
jgi:predicted Zn-dependent peptidase